MTAVDPVATPTVRQVADGVCVRVAIDNMGWVDMGDSVLLVDALEQPELEDEVVSGIRAAFGDKPVRWLLNTHTHYDHTALNDAFRTRFGTEIVNQRDAPLPSEGRWFAGSGRRALMLPVPGCHTNEDCIVWLPDARVLFTGDIFGWGLIPWEGRLTVEKKELITGTYARLIEYDPECVTPGHGPLCSRSELARWLGYFGDLVERVSAGCRDGRSDDEIRGQLPPPEDMGRWWRFCQWKHDDTVAKVLRAVRSGDLPAAAG